MSPPVHAPSPKSSSKVSAVPLLRRTTSSSTVSSDGSADEFYTPLSSPRTSVTHPSSDPSSRLSFSALAAALAPVATPVVSPPSTRSTSPSNESVSVFSHSSSVPSTNITTPLASEDKHGSYFPPTPDVTYLKVPGVGPRVIPVATRPGAALPSSSSDSRIDYGRAQRRLTPSPSPSMGPSASASTSSSHSYNRPRPRAPHMQAPLKKRMSAVYEESDEDLQSEGHSIAGGSSQQHDGPPRLLRHTSLTRRQARSRTSSASSASVSALPAPLPTSASDGDAYTPPAPGNGYTTLVLPRASYVPKSGDQVARAIARGSVDLARAGIAQTTMATVEVVAGVARKRAGRSLSFRMRAPFRRDSSSSSPAAASGSRRRAGSSTSGKDKDGDELDGTGMMNAMDDAMTERALGFTSHVPPPTHVPANSVLVRVAAVGLDGVDARLTAERAGSVGGAQPSVGWIPGRSFVGRAVEIGSSVREGWIKKGEWVVGLMDVHKVALLLTNCTIGTVWLTCFVWQCGALAEFVVIERRRLYRTPRPKPTRGSPPRGQAVSSLTVEELALLPVVGVPAFRAIRTFSWPDPGSGHAAPRALVLQAHDGAGAVAVQLLAAKGAHIHAHVPRAHSAMDTRLRDWGVSEILPGSALAVLSELRDAGTTFDFILDTVGGRAIWNAARALLSTSGPSLFVTTVGDSPDRPVPSGQDHFRAGMRSLGIGHGERPGAYAWVSIGADTDLEGEDVCDALQALLGGSRSQNSPVVRPWVPVREDERRVRVLPFERASGAFGKGAGALRMGGTAVVTIMD
jgi:NADPH:quinone reductase-like Zn-dependent oxidoreductase